MVVFISYLEIFSYCCNTKYHRVFVAFPNIIACLTCDLNQSVLNLFFSLLFICQVILLDTISIVRQLSVNNIILTEPRCFTFIQSSSLCERLALDIIYDKYSCRDVMKMFISKNIGLTGY